MTVVSNIHQCPAWITLNSYTLVGTRVTNDTGPLKAYQLVTAGVSGATGPTGTGSSIADGTCVWKYLSSADYSSISAWWAAQAATLTTPIEADMWNDNTATNGAPVEWPFSSTTALGGITSSATNTVLITAAPGESFVDSASAQTNALRYNLANGVALKTTSNYLRGVFSWATAYSNVTRLQMRNTGAGNDEACLDYSGSNTQASISQCIFQNANSVGSNSKVVNGRDTGPNYLINNCLVVMESPSGAGQGIGIVSTQSGNEIENCTVVAPSNKTAGTGFGITSGYGTVTVRNCAIFNIANPLGGATFNADGHNATDQSAMGKTSTGNLVGQAFTTATFVQPSNASAAMDFRVVTGSALLNVGSASAVEAYDIVGTVRPQGSAYDIGCWELVVAAAVTKFRRTFSSLGTRVGSRSAVMT